MKHFLCFFLLLALLASCNKDRADDGCLYTGQGEIIVLTDGTLARLSVIEDARCPCFANCTWEGYIGMTITVGSDTILSVSDVFGAWPEGTSPENRLYLTRRGDRIQLVNVFEPEDSCPGSVPGEDLCLELALL